MPRQSSKRRARMAQAAKRAAADDAAAALRAAKANAAATTTAVAPAPTKTSARVRERAALSALASAENAPPGRLARTVSAPAPGAALPPACASPRVDAPRFTLRDLMNAPDAPLASLRSPVRQMAAARHHKPTLKSRLAAAAASAAASDSDDARTPRDGDDAENRPPTASRDERPAGSITPHPIRWDSVAESPESDVAAALANASEPEPNRSAERDREATRKTETTPPPTFFETTLASKVSSPSRPNRSTKRKSNPTDERVARADASLEQTRRFVSRTDDVASLHAAGRAHAALTRWRASAAIARAEAELGERTKTLTEMLRDQAREFDEESAERRGELRDALGANADLTARLTLLEEDVKDLTEALGAAARERAAATWRLATRAATERRDAATTRAKLRRVVAEHHHESEKLRAELAEAKRREEKEKEKEKREKEERNGVVVGGDATRTSGGAGGGWFSWNRSETAASSAAWEATTRAALEASLAPVVRDELRGELRGSLESRVREELRVDLRAAVEADLRESLRPAAEAAAKAAAKADAEATDKYLGDFARMARVGLARAQARTTFAASVAAATPSRDVSAAAAALAPHSRSSLRSHPHAHSHLTPPSRSSCVALPVPATRPGVRVAPHKPYTPSGQLSQLALHTVEAAAHARSRLNPLRGANVAELVALHEAAASKLATQAGELAHEFEDYAASVFIAPAALFADVNGRGAVEPPPTTTSTTALTPTNAAVVAPPRETGADEANRETPAKLRERSMWDLWYR